MQYHGLPPTPEPSEAGGDTARDTGDEEKTEEQDDTAAQTDKKEAEDSQAASEKGTSFIVLLCLR